jgi:hypothetical protein
VLLLHHFGDGMRQTAIECRLIDFDAAIDGFDVTGQFGRANQTANVGSKNTIAA